MQPPKRTTSQASSCSISPLTTLNTLSQNFTYCELSIRRCGERLHHEPHIVPPLNDNVAIGARDMAPSRLLALPAELRTMIWAYALSGEPLLGVGGYYHNSNRIPPSFHGAQPAKQATQPALTFVCRQIRSESLPLFYHLNRFVLAVHYRQAKNEVEKWLAVAAENPSIGANLNNVTILHRFGMLEYRGTIDVDLKQSSTFGPQVWFNSMPSSIMAEANVIVNSAVAAGTPDDRLIVAILTRLVEVLGV